MLLNRDFRPEMISLRRRMIGASQSEIAKSTGISQATISKLEQGLREPNDEHIELLAQSLACSASFFFQTEREYGPPLSVHPMFRKKASVGQKVMDKVIAEFSVRLGHARMLLSSVDFEPELPLPRYEADDYSDHIEDVANMVRRSWYMPRGPIKSLTEYLERAGVLIIPMRMDAARIDGASYQVPGLPPVIFINNSLSSDRQRFTLAHELGHIVMHSFPSPEMEKQADEFAAALLMPEQDIAADLKNFSLQKAAQLKPYWRVSMAALIVRAGTLGKIDSGASAYLWRQMSSLGYRTREPTALDFPAERPTLTQALFQNLTYNMQYSNEDLEQALHLRYAELADMYDLPLRQNALKIVK